MFTCMILAYNTYTRCAIVITDMDLVTLNELWTQLSQKMKSISVAGKRKVANKAHPIVYCASNVDVVICLYDFKRLIDYIR